MRQNIYSVGQINTYIKNMFGQDYLLNRLYVRGEVSNCKYHTSGHIYFSLKDETGAIACVMFAAQRSNMKFRLAEGQGVIALGSVRVYERDGKYQLYANEIVLDGVGLLYERFQALKNTLEEMGMFAPEYKKPIPKYAKRIGIVTAPTGAAIRDIMNISYRRNPYVQLILYPAQVQGEGAKESIVRGIRMLEKQQVDVIIVGRGGGSIEDLWAFNEEIVARAIFECSIPIISAVGHETDTTIADYVSDLRAPTPSAAAELAVFDYRQLENQKLEYKLKMQRILVQRIEVNRLKMEKMETKLRYLHPENKLREYRQRLVELEDRLRNTMQNHLQMKKHRFQIYLEKMKGLSPLQKLSQGFSYVETDEKQVLKSISQVKPGDMISVYVTDGIIKASVEEIKEEQHG